MPSAKYTFFTRDDEANLTEALKVRFPNIRFFTFKGHPKPDWRYLDGIHTTDTETVEMVLAPPSWEPEIVIYEDLGDDFHRIANYPDEVMFLKRSCEAVDQKKFIERGSRQIGSGNFQVGITRVMTKAQKSFANKVWRLLGKIGTYRLKTYFEEDMGGHWGEMPGKTFVAGNDAVRWALEDESRCFHLVFDMRPF